MLLLSIGAYLVLPADVGIPLHLDRAGRTPVQYAGKFEALLLAPTLAMALSMFILWTASYGQEQLEALGIGSNAMTAWLRVIALLAVLHVGTVFTALGGLPQH
jgi:hypothetical protein